MRTRFKHLPASYFGSLILIVALASCSGYQSTSYYPSDGIYGGEMVSRTKTAPVENSKDNNNSKEVYYKDYFSNVADDYASLDNPQQYVFTDTDNYSINRGNANVQVNSQAPWGDQTSRTEIYYINNNPWGYFNNGWGFNNSFYDPFWGYRPFYGGFYNRPFWGLGFYHPYSWYRYQYFGHPFYNRFRPYRGFYNNGYNRSYARSGYSRGSAGNYNYNNSRSSRAVQNSSRTGSSRANGYNKTGSNTTTGENRYNVGRRVQSSANTNRSNGTAGQSSTSRSNQKSNYRSSPQSSSRSYSDNNSQSRRSNYNSGRSYSSSRSSYSSSGRSSSSYSSGSRGSSSSSSSRGRR